jgi:hypothetical protein
MLLLTIVKGNRKMAGAVLLRLHTNRGCQIFLGTKYQKVSIKYTKIFHCKTPQNLPEFDFWFENKPSGNPATNK